MNRYEGIKKSIEIRKEDVKEADAHARTGPLADYYRARAQRCREDIEFLEKELERVKAPFTLIQGGKDTQK